MAKVSKKKRKKLSTSDRTVSVTYKKKISQSQEENSGLERKWDWKVQAWVEDNQDQPSSSRLLPPRSQSLPKMVRSSSSNTIRSQNTAKSSIRSRKSSAGSPKKTSTPRSKGSTGKTRPISDVSLSSTDSRVLLRSMKEKNENPTKLFMDRKRLARCYQVKKEPELEAINYQHNAIELIEFVAGYSHLSYLDFYDNRIDEISGLERLPALKVLILGKNQIKKISGLEELSALEMLDLHSNYIEEIENLSHLQHLRILNLSGNQITKADNFEGLSNLSELNLRRNKIQTTHFVLLEKLEKLFLSYNDLNSMEEILSSLEKCTALQELTLDGNPLSQSQHYKTTILKNLDGIKYLDMRKITDSERGVISKALQKEKEKEQRAKELAEKEADRTNRILAAQALWETEQLHLPPFSHSQSKEQSERTVLFGELKPQTAGERGYAEILGNVVKFYGRDSLGAFEKNWGSAANNVTAIKFKWTEFDYVAQTFSRLKIKFPHVNTLTLSHANLRILQQLNALIKLKNLNRLVVVPAGNPLCNFTLWKEYVAFILASEINLLYINEQEVTEDFLAKARAAFGPLKSMANKLNPTLKMISLNVGGNLDKGDSLDDMESLGAKEFMRIVSDGNLNTRYRRSEEAGHQARILVRDAFEQTVSENNVSEKVKQLFPQVLEEISTDLLNEMEKDSFDSYVTSRLEAFSLWNKTHK